jgi:hypothetical protein
MLLRAVFARWFSLLLFLIAMVAVPVRAADHRDAPFVDGAPEGDITDLFAFTDPNDSARLVLAMGVNSFAVPAAPGTYSFSPDYLYQFKIDSNGDGVEDHVVQIKFRNVAGGGQVVQVFGPSRPVQIGARNQLTTALPAVQGPTGVIIGDPNRVLTLTGLRDDPFVFDLSQFNRILAGSQDVFRDLPSTPVGPLRGRAVNGDGTSGVDSFNGFNASYIVVSFPKDWVRGTTSKIGVWATVSRPFIELASRGPLTRNYVQFERMGQQAFATVFIPKPLKDAFNFSAPADDVARWSQFVPDALTTTDNDGTGNTISGRAAVLDALGLDSLPNGAPLLLPPTFGNTNRNLLRVALLPDVLRLDLDLASNDHAIGQFGLQNGRRPGDDVIDIALRLLRQLADVNFPAALGVPGSGPPRPGALNFPADRRVFVVLQGTDFIRPDATLGDLSISGNDVALPATFPYVAPPHLLP